jgi:hypothetical protein
MKDAFMDDNIFLATRRIRYRENDAVWRLRGDICVVGAGIAGLSAALEAAYGGKKVILLDGQGQLGGQTYNSCIGCFCGFYSNGDPGYQLTHGIADDLFRCLKTTGGLYENPINHTRVPYYNELHFLRWAEKKVQEAGIQVLLGAVLSGVEKKGRRITGLEAVTRYGKVIISADGFIDASGDAVVAWLAGLPCNVPETGSVYGSQMFILEGIDFSSETPSEEALAERMEQCAEKYHLFRKKGLMFYTPGRGGGSAYGNMTHVDTPLDPVKASRIVMTGKDEADKVVDFLKQEYPALFSRANIRSYGQTGIRQTRWLSGRTQISLADIREGKKYLDSIARVAWPVELHNHEDGYIWEVFDTDHIHYIPLGSMISPEADNYAACGRCIDGDVAALSSVRVMGPCTATGAAAAHALVLAGKGSVHDINIQTLQERLSDNLTRCD